MPFRMIWSGSQQFWSGSRQRLQRYWQRYAPGSFIQAWLASPKAIGAICPSSRFLARRIAQHTPLPTTGIIVELGPGTGVVTRALLERGIDPARLILIEFCAHFVKDLREKFPAVTVIHGNAADLSSLLGPETPVQAIVSSLPLCSLPAPLTRAILDEWQRVLGPNQGLAIQFTYNMGHPKWLRMLDAEVRSAGVVWANLPPARVSTLRFKPCPLLNPPHHDTSLSNPSS